jgi:hypothetical protein
MFHIPEAPGSSLGPKIVYTERIFVDFLSPSMNMTGYYITLGHILFLHIVSNPLFIKHPVN